MQPRPPNSRGADTRLISIWLSVGIIAFLVLSINQQMMNMPAVAEQHIPHIDAQIAPQIAPRITFSVNSTGNEADFDLNDGVCNTNPPSTTPTPANCTLRAAIQQANNSPAGDLITFGFGGSSVTITIPTGLPDITTFITIDGTGKTITLDGLNNNRIFKITSTGSLTLKTLILTKGFMGSGTNGGAAISNEGNLNLLNVIISDSKTAADFGGGIRQHTNGNAQLIMVNSLVLNNEITSDAADTRGAGIAIDVGNAFIYNSTISGNRISSSDGAANGRGAGIYVNAPNKKTTLINVTVTNNEVQRGTNGDGIEKGSAGGSELEVFNSIISNNGDNGNSSQNVNCLGIITAVSSNNLEFPGNTCGTGFTDADPNLQGLASNGGFTQTHAITTGSPAIAAGNFNRIPADILDMDNDGNVTEKLPFDQRGTGFARIFGAIVDAGAFEAVVNDTPTPTNTNTNTNTATNTNTPTNTATFTPSNTPTNTPTFTPTWNRVTAVNPGGIQIIDALAGNFPQPAVPYPAVVGIPPGSVLGFIKDNAVGDQDAVVVRVNGLNHSFASDLDLLLVSPSGRYIVLMSDAGGSRAFVNANIAFRDSAAPPPNDTGTGNITGNLSYEPSNYSSITGNCLADPDVAFLPDAPTITVAADSLNAAFRGTDPIGAWRLYVMDDCTQEEGSISSWSIEIITSLVGTGTPGNSGYSTPVIPTAVLPTITNTPTFTRTPTPTNTRTLPPTDTPTRTASPTQTIIPSPTPSPIPEIANVLLNPGMETAQTNPVLNEKIPANWTQTIPTSDRRKCNTDTKIIARTGICAYQFKGSSTENSRLTQEVPIDQIALGDTLKLDGWISATGTGVNVRFLVRAHYFDGTSERMKLTVKVITTGYQQLAPVPDTDIANGVNTLELDKAFRSSPHPLTFEIRNRSISGKVWIDDLQLSVLQTGSAQGTIGDENIPLPPSEGGN